MVIWPMVRAHLVTWDAAKNRRWTLMLTIVFTPFFTVFDRRTLRTTLAEQAAFNRGKKSVAGNDTASAIET